LSILAFLDFKLYYTSLETANDAKEKLKQAISELLEMSSEDVVLLFKPVENHVSIKFIVINPSQEITKLCQGNELATRLRAKVFEENILPNQQRKKINLFR
jgi:hypothetical protein